MGQYQTREAILSDAPFIAEVIIEAEKGPTNMLGFSTLFGLEEKQVKEAILAMLQEEIEGCEFCIDNYLITEFEGKPVASFGGFIEKINNNPPSKVLKSNLIGVYFPPESLIQLKANAAIMNEIILEREPQALQLEYGYVKPEHRGKNLLIPIIEKLIERAMVNFPPLKKVQVQCFKNNLPMIRLLEKIGFSLVAEVSTENPAILNFLPYSSKVLMEKSIH